MINIHTEEHYKTNVKLQDTTWHSCKCMLGAIMCYSYVDELQPQRSQPATW